MTTYYAKPFEGVSEEIFDVNPALYTGVATKLGRFPYESKDPWNEEYVHFNSIVKACKTRFADAPGWDAVPDSLPHPGFRKAKWFYWNHTITEKQYKSLQNNPRGMLAQQLRIEVKGQQDQFLSDVDHYLLGFLYADDDDDYDPMYKPLMQNNATGTVDNPEDINATPGTTTATGIKFTGATQVVDAYNKGIGSIKARFLQQYNSRTKQAMYKQNNTFDLWAHPAALDVMRRGHEINSNGYYDYSKNYLDLMQSDNVQNMKTFAVDAEYDGESTTVAEYLLTMNTSENFMITEMIPYTIEPYKWNPGTRLWELRAYWKILTIVKPYYIDGLWKKAMTSASIIPYNA